MHSIIDPERGGPCIWFQVVPEAKSIKNRFHFGVHASGGRSVPLETRKERVNAEAQRLAGRVVSYGARPGAPARSPTTPRPGR